MCIVASFHAPPPPQSPTPSSLMVLGGVPLLTCNNPIRRCSRHFGGWRDGYRTSAQLVSLTRQLGGGSVNSLLISTISCWIRRFVVLPTVAKDFIFKRHVCHIFIPTQHKISSKFFDPRSTTILEISNGRVFEMIFHFKAQLLFSIHFYPLK